MTKTRVPITVFARTTSSPAHTYQVIVPIDLAQVFKPWGPLPGVAEVRDQTGTWNRPGTTRQTWFTDGSKADERLTEIAEGHGFAYELSGFTNVLAKLTSGVRGEWSFLPDGTGTSIRWTYDFRPLPGRRWIVAGPFKQLWIRYMRAALTRMVTVVQETPPRTGSPKRSMTTERVICELTDDLLSPERAGLRHPCRSEGSGVLG